MARGGEVRRIIKGRLAALGAALGDALGELVVGDALGELVVGDALGAALGDALGELVVGDALRAALGDAVGDAVSAASHPACVEIDNSGGQVTASENCKGMGS